ncbi:MAG TPA: hypothetical protein VGG34_02500 [Opitutaceae bacterium]|jgi:flagellar motility protein MotE (MotC chaperone)
MKKKRIYVWAPIIFLICFIAYYYSFSKNYAARQAEVAARVQAQKDLKAQEDAKKTQAAIDQAVAEAAKNKAAHLARVEQEQKQRDDMDNAKLDRDKAEQESQKLERQVEKLTKDVASEKDDIARVQDQEKRSDQDFAFLKQYIVAAQANQGRLADVIAKIEAADAAVARNAAIAEAAKKNQ